MKKLILFTTISLSFQSAFCQNFLPAVVPYVVTGFAQILDENPFVLSQRAGTNNTWSYMASYTWTPSTIQGYHKERTVSQFSGNTWILNQLEQSEYVLDNQNRFASVIQDRTYNYNGTPNRSKIRYLFTYNAENKPSRVVMQIAEGPSYTNFVNYYNSNYTYNTEGKLIADSMYFYYNQQSYKRDYTYDASGKPVRQSDFDFSSDDTTSKTTYTFDGNGRLLASYTTSLNQTSDVWETTAADTFNYDQNGNIIKRINYGAAFIDGQLIPFMPVINETYGYNSLNKLDQMETKSWNENTLSWVNASKYSFNYTNGNPSIGYMYNWNSTSQAYDSLPAVRFLFALPTALNETGAIQVSDLAVYPNPATNKVFVSFAAPGAFEQPVIRLYNLSGQAFTTPVTFQNGVAELDISDLSSGIYSIQIQAGEHVIRKKLLIR